MGLCYTMKKNEISIAENLYDNLNIIDSHNEKIIFVRCKIVRQASSDSDFRDFIVLQDRFGKQVGVHSSILYNHKQFISCSSSSDWFIISRKLISSYPHKEQYRVIYDTSINRWIANDHELKDLLYG